MKAVLRANSKIGIHDILSERSVNQSIVREDYKTLVCSTARKVNADIVSTGVFIKASKRKLTILG